MKKGKTIVELAQELQRVQEQQKDFIVPNSMMNMRVQEKENLSTGEVTKTPVLEFRTNGGKSQFEPNHWANIQVAAHTNIPRQYYERIAKENPELLVKNVNHGLERIAHLREKDGKPQSRMVRTVGGTMRAFLSSRYRRLDSHDLLETVLPTLQQHEFEVLSAEYTEQRIYLKAVTKKVQGEVKQGDVVQYGLLISSSDVGAGSLRVEPLIYRLVCLNGMVMDTAIRKFHIGKEQATEAAAYELFTDETRQLTDQAFWHQVRDVVTGSMNPERFQRELNKLKEAAEDKITNFDLPKVVELAAKEINITGEQTKQSIVGYLANGADGAGLTRWGLVNGITYAAQQDHVDYDQSVELERAASKVLELPRHRWSRIAEKK